MAGIKKKATKKVEQPVIEVEASGQVEAEEVESFDVETSEPTNVETSGYNANYVVKLDTKRIDARDYQQVMSLVQGALGGVKKITIEME